MMQSYDVKLVSMKHSELQLSLHHPQQWIHKVMTLGSFTLLLKLPTYLKYNR